MVNAKVYEPGTVEPGWTTTEFYQTVFIHVITAVVAVGTLFKSDFNLDGVQAIVPSAAIAASMIAQVVYNLGRAKVKTAASLSAADAASAADEAKAAIAQTAGGAPATAPATSISGLGLPTI